MKAHLLFEQSGTFKKEFIKLGVPAEDYDIQNEFGETDHVIDLYAEIEGGYEGNPSIFDNMQEDDIVMAFFPCIRFENQILIWFRGQSISQKKWSDEQKILYDMNLLAEVKHNYDIVSKITLICLRKGLKLIMENPYSEEHFLRRYWCIQPTIIDYDRTMKGDYYQKPTQYWFINCEPKNNLIFEPLNYNAIEVKNAFKYLKKEDAQKMGTDSIKTARSMIHPDYANRFIREYIL